jgi:hypothetical protein
MPPKAQASRAAGVSVNSVKDAILDSINQLETKMKANPKFFPFGINDIEVGITVGGVEVSLKVSGPDSGSGRAGGEPGRQA